MTDAPDCCWQCRAMYWVGEANRAMEKSNERLKTEMRQRVEINRLRRLIKEVFDHSDPPYGPEGADRLIMLPHALAEAGWFKRARAAIDLPLPAPQEKSP